MLPSLTVTSRPVKALPVTTARGEPGPVQGPCPLLPPARRPLLGTGREGHAL
jgi:hypothetical protein